MQGPKQIPGSSCPSSPKEKETEEWAGAHTHCRSQNHQLVEGASLLGRDECYTNETPSVRKDTLDSRSGSIYQIVALSSINIGICTWAAQIQSHCTLMPLANRLLIFVSLLLVLLLHPFLHCAVLNMADSPPGRDHDFIMSDLQLLVQGLLHGRDSVCAGRAQLDQSAVFRRKL